MLEFWNNIGSEGQKYVMIIAGGMIVYFIGIWIYMKKKKGDVSKWLAENPTAAKVYIVSKSGMVRFNGLMINAIDGQAPVLFQEGIKTGFYALPGTRLVDSTFTTTRPGVLYRSVTTTYGPTRQELTLEANKTYHYSFDLKTKSYEFKEV